MNSSSGAAGPSDEHGFRSGLETSLGRIDQGITAHSFLRDKFRRRAGLLSSLIVLGAALVTFLAVSSAGIKAALSLSDSGAEHLTGLLGFVVLLCSILELQLGWREKGSHHAEASNALARLKLLIARELGSDLPLTRARYTDLQQAYENINDLVARIPERRFLELKALHRRKVEISKFLDHHPGSSIILLRTKMWIRDNMNTWPSRE
jgi:hypothetical protein